MVILAHHQELTLANFVESALLNQNISQHVGFAAKRKGFAAIAGKFKGISQAAFNLEAYKPCLNSDLIRRPSLKRRPCPCTSPEFSRTTT